MSAPMSLKRAGFLREALAADAAVESGAPLYRAEEIHDWLARLARGEKPARPAPCKALSPGSGQA